jgi:hypothetical protein
MTGVGTARVAHDNVEVLQQQVDDLALPLIAPLEPEDARVAQLAKTHIGPFQRLSVPQRKPAALPDATAQLPKPFFSLNGRWWQLPTMDAFTAGSGTSPAGTPHHQSRSENGVKSVCRSK